MENCFRFLINVDQCLNMSHFDMFFYRLESQHKFHMSSVQMFGDDAGSSLRNAVSDIRMYLDKYPYHVGDYQIIVAMRSVFRPQVSVWEETMLYRLLRLDRELRRARILINSRERTEKALNLIMLYDADYAADLAEPENYKESGRLLSDCSLLLQKLSIGANASQEELEQSLAACLDKDSVDPAAAELLQGFADFRRKSQEQLQALSAHLDPVSIYANSEAPLATELAEFVRNLLFNFQIFEEQIDRNNRRQQILALLRVTEFINMSTEQPPRTDGTTTVISLSQICAANWEKIWADPTLEQRYADMLYRYRSRLHRAAIELESSTVSSDIAKPLPGEEIPENNAIQAEDSIFSDSDSKDRGKDLKSLFSRFLGRSFSLSDLQAHWNDTYESTKALLQQMEYTLKTYAQTLSHKYADELEKRKQDSILWKSGFYIATPETEQDITRLAHERDQRLEQLKSPHMTPSLSFQDQLNMENALEQTNLTVRFYLRCLSAINVSAFLMLAGACALLGILHYTLLQPYVFAEAATIVCYLSYLAAVAVLMLLCWFMPYNHFRTKLKHCIEELQASTDLYINGYYTKAGHFHTYINLLNQLDYITRYHRLLVKAHAASHKLSQGYLWHKVQVQHHLHKLQFFQGLIALAQAQEAYDTTAAVPDIDGDRVCDYVDSPIYWPQD